MKHTEETLLKLTTGDIIYHVNPYGCDLNKPISVSLIVITSPLKHSTDSTDISPYFESVKVFIHGDKNYKRLGSYSDHFYIADNILHGKGCFSTQYEAEIFADTLKYDNSIVQAVTRHKALCTGYPSHQMFYMDLTNYMDGFLWY